MIDLYSAATPNGQKIHIMLEDTGLPYRVRWVSLGKGEQSRPEFLKISPNNKIPAIVDDDGPDGEPIALFESGAILIYLAEKTGRFLPKEPRARLEVLQWLFWQMGGFGPMLGQAEAEGCQQASHAWSTSTFLIPSREPTAPACAAAARWRSPETRPGSRSPAEARRRTAARRARRRGCRDR
jgi:glutathione S-transferase